MENDENPPTNTRTDPEIEALAAIKQAYRKSRATRRHEPIEGLEGAKGWRIMTLIVLHKSAGPRESLELVAPDCRRLNVGKGYLPELVAMFLQAGAPIPSHLLN
jgi:hypothetical protein